MSATMEKNAEPKKKRHVNSENELNMSEQIHHDGRAAFKAGLAITDNPYPESKDVWAYAWVKYTAWNNGWRYAQMMENKEYV